MTPPLDNPVLASLTGPHAGLALTRGRAAHYPADIVPFCALPGEPDAADWADAAGLLGPGEEVLFPALRATPPPGWEVLGLGPGVQLVATGLDAAPDEEAVPLGPADVPEMLSLTQRAKPGPTGPHSKGDMKRSPRLCARADHCGLLPVLWDWLHGNWAYGRNFDGSIVTLRIS